MAHWLNKHIRKQAGNRSILRKIGVKNPAELQERAERNNWDSGYSKYNKVPKSNPARKLAKRVLRNR